MDVFRHLTVGVKFKSQKDKELLKVFQGKTSAVQEMIKFDPDLNVFANQATVEKRPLENENDNEHSDVDSVNEDSLEENDYSQHFEREDELNAFRNRLRIKVKGDNIPWPNPTFQEMAIQKDMKTILLQNIELSKWKEPTPIQMQAIPTLLNQRDVLACAPTGSGKTAAYLIPTLSRLRHHRKSYGIRALLLSPTKELADQIFRECSRLSEGKTFKICNLKKNIMTRALEQQEGAATLSKFDILIATPLRLVSLIRANVIDLSRVEIIVLDEADKLLELDSKEGAAQYDQEDPDQEEEEEEEEGKKRERSSFLKQMDEILAQCSTSDQSIVVQRALFSATIGPFVRELASAFLQNPIEISIGTENSGASTIDQKLVFVGREDGKLLAIRQLVQEGLTPPVLIFVQSIDRARDLFKELVFDGINVDFMHSARSAIQREEVIRRFRMGEIWVLICTDLMGRGIDFKGVQMVINYDLPLTPVSYIHRIGRTGRAGKTGKAITFFTEEDIPRIRPIANVMKLSGCPVPEWMLSIKPLTTKRKRQLRRHAPTRRRVGTSSTPKDWETEGRSVSSSSARQNKEEEKKEEVRGESSEQNPGHSEKPRKKRRKMEK